MRLCRRLSLLELTGNICLYAVSHALNQRWSCRGEVWRYCGHRFWKHRIPALESIARVRGERGWGEGGDVEGNQPALPQRFAHIIQRPLSPLICPAAACGECRLPEATFYTDYTHREPNGWLVHLIYLQNNRIWMNMREYIIVQESCMVTLITAAECRPCPLMMMMNRNCVSLCKQLTSGRYKWWPIYYLSQTCQGAYKNIMRLQIYWKIVWLPRSWNELKRNERTSGCVRACGMTKNRPETVLQLQFEYQAIIIMAHLSETSMVNKCHSAITIYIRRPFNLPSQMVSVARSAV